MGKPFAFLEQDLNKLYFLKHRKWFHFDEKIDLKNGFFSYDYRRKKFFKLNCEINTHLVIYTYMYFNVDVKSRKITQDVIEKKSKKHIIENLSPEYIGNETFKYNEFLEFEIEKNMSLIFMVTDAFVLVMTYNCCKGIMNSIVIKFS